jgi:hypothetical protein
MGIDGLVLMALWAILVAVKVFALFDCIRRPAEYFPYLNRQSKPLWLILTAVALLTGLAPGLTLSIFGIAGTVIALVYLFDIRPKMIEITGKKY